jgi:hypothetical protein
MDIPGLKAHVTGRGVGADGGMLANGLLGSEHAASKFKPLRWIWSRHTHKALDLRDRSWTVIGLYCNSSRMQYWDGSMG